MDMIYKEIIH